MNRLKTCKQIICYIDLLGTKEKIKKDTNDEILNVINDCYKKVIKIKDLITTGTTALPYKIKIFSDNIIISSESNPSRKDDNHVVIAFNRITTIAMAIQRELLKCDIFIRGSITWDNLYIDDLFVYGKGLVDAYKLECEDAIYPRIIVDSKLVDLLERCYKANNESVLMVNNVIKDKDGLYFLNYLNYLADTNVNQLIDNSYSKIDRLISTQEDIRTRQKLIWHKQYLESLITKRENQNDNQSKEYKYSIRNERAYKTISK